MRLCARASVRACACVDLRAEAVGDAERRLEEHAYAYVCVRACVCVRARVLRARGAAQTEINLLHVRHERLTEPLRTGTHTAKPGRYGRYSISSAVTAVTS